MLKVGMIGGGYFGQFHINAWLRMKDIALVGVVVRNDSRRHALKSLYPHTEFYSDFGSLREQQSDLDILDIATPPQSHFGLVEAALGTLPLIICQKPFCTSLEEAERLTVLADASTTELAVHENFRFMPWYRTIKNEIDTGHLGTIRQAHFRMRPGDGNGEDAYLARQPYFREMKRFLIHETGIHWIDVFRFLLGEPQRVFADLWQTNPALAGEDSGLLLLGWENGLRAIFDGNRTLDHAAENHRLTMGEFIIEGEKATLTLSGDGSINIRQRGSNSQTPISYKFQDIDFGGDCVYHFQKHVVEHVKNGTPLETKARDYLRNIAIEETVYHSAANGTAMTLDEA